MRHVLAVTLVFAISKSTEAIFCKICPEGHRSLTDCQKVGKCTGDSVCFIDVYVDRQGIKRAYTGCRSRETCKKNGLLTKRQSTDDIGICSSCCETDFCNANACGYKPPTGFKECFSCTSVDNPSDCEQTVLCSDTQDCMTEYRYAGAGKANYRMDCERALLCQLRDDYIGNFSRRSIGDINSQSGALIRASEKEPPMSDQQREVGISKEPIKREISDPNSICLSCCDYSFCNIKENCHLNQEAPPPRPTTP